MPMTIDRARRACAVLVVAGVTAGCSAPDKSASTQPREVTRTGAQALATSNGLSQNGLTTNGLVSNGAWFNGAWFNGAWFNGAWFNGAWFNGLFSNTLWANGVNPDGGPPAAGTPAAALQSSAYLSQLLPDIYGCAMPGALDPITNTPIDPTTYNTTLDPNNGTLKCAAPDVGGEEAGADGGPACDVGYTCSPQGTCVIALHGEVGLGINANGTAWWGETADGGGGVGGAPGTCDESCQRWVSACVLARTNAYGAHVAISMRAPADPPQAIRNALATSPTEPATYPLREGAYYGNIFETAPVPSTAPATADGGPYSGPATGPIVETPSFYACAGPESNVPEITKRFCSSQGDQVVISVRGVGLTIPPDAGAPQTGVCVGEDTDAGSLTFGAIQDCYTSAGTTTAADGGITGTGTLYNQVITVYLKEPIAVC